MQAAPPASDAKDSKDTKDIEATKPSPPLPLLSRFLRLIAPFKNGVDPNSKFFIHFRLSIAMIKTAHIILVPLMLAWPVYFESYILVAYFIVFDLVFVFDRLVSSCEIQHDIYGAAIKDAVTLMKLYFRNGYWILLLTSLPLDLLAFSINAWDGPNSMIQGFQVWVLIRLFKVSAQGPYSEFFDLKFPGLQLPISRLVKTMIILMSLGHIYGCVFWFLDIVLERAPNRWVDENNLLLDVNLNPVSFETQYIHSYLAALKSLVLKLRTVKKNGENMYVVLEFITGILAYGTVFGNIHSIVEMLDKTAVQTQAEEQHNFQMELLRKYMKEKKLNPELQRLIHDHKELQWRRSEGMNHERLFDDIPKQVQQEVKNWMYLDMIQTMPLFRGTDRNFQNSIVFKIRPLDILKDSFLFRKGEEGQEMYFIKNGQVAILGAQGQVLVNLFGGSFFGEIALFEDCRRTASAYAATHLELYVLGKSDFVEIVNQYPEVADRVIESIQARKLNEARMKAEDAKKAEAKNNKSASSLGNLMKAASKGSLFSSKNSLGKNKSKDVARPNSLGSRNKSDTGGKDFVGDDKV